MQHKGLIISEHVEQTASHDLKCQSPALTSSRSADWRILQDTRCLLYEFQKQFPSTQQEEIFHKFQLQEQFSLFHSKFPQMLHRTKAGIKLPIIFNYITPAASFQLQKTWSGNHIWIDNCKTSQFYLNNIPYGPVTTFKWHITWPCNHTSAMSEKDQQINTWYRQPPTVPTNEVHEDNVKFYIRITLSVCFIPTFYARYFENSISSVKIMNKMHSIICFL